MASLENECSQLQNDIDHSRKVYLVSFTILRLKGQIHSSQFPSGEHRFYWKGLDTALSQMAYFCSRFELRRDSSVWFSVLLTVSPLQLKTFYLAEGSKVNFQFIGTFVEFVNWSISEYANATQKFTTALETLCNVSFCTIIVPRLKQCHLKALVKMTENCWSLFLAYSRD